MQGIIQVAIGLIFVFSLLSILVTTVNTVITNFLQWRAKHLKSALENLITDPELRDQFLTHPLINILKPGATTAPDAASPMALRIRNSAINTINYIDPKTFAQVLSSLLAEKAGIELYGPLLLAMDALPDSPAKQHLLDMFYAMQNTSAGLSDLRSAIMLLPAEQQPALISALKPIEDRSAASQLSSEDGSRLLPILDGLRKVNDDSFRRALRVIIASARSIDEAEQNLEDWFNQRMDQLSDVYKRHVVYLTLVIGLVLALAVNADTLQMARALWTDPALRESLVNAATDRANQTPAATPIPPPDATAEPSTDITQPISDFANTFDQLINLNLPIGWENTSLAECQQAKDPLPTMCDNQRNLWLLVPGNNPNWFGLLLRKIIGIIVTVIAIGQGAPFWFDLIRRLVQPRSS